MTLAHNIMIQGTMSNVGKSLLCAALCRVLKQDGIRCAPFKSQNMALNSGVTEDGLEMGRAQILQAQAAGIEPDARMNPILLKPTGDHTSQVILNGEVAGTYGAREYFALRKGLVPEILKAYESLSREYDVIVIEGAGSPAEINLKRDDIVNMGLAKLVDAPVLLAGDIDPGGVFAQLFGTVQLLEEEERRRVKGFLINKFRGDQTLLDDGVRMLEEKLGIPSVGIMPYLALDLDEEDSLSPDLRVRGHGRSVDIAVIRFPRISNFTDLDPLSAHPLLGVRYVREAQEFGMPDLVILPGTKSTIGDLRWLTQTGLSDRILDAAGQGALILGICGGYQMLGTMLSDPEGTEGEGRVFSEPGLGLLPVKTIFRKEKTRRRISGRAGAGYLTGAYLSGYEIHMGQTMWEDGSEDPGHAGAPGLVCGQDNVCGTYLHGLFDSGEAVDLLAALFAERKGLPLPAYRSKDRGAHREQELDVLADAFRAHMDMGRIRRLLQL